MVPSGLSIITRSDPATRARGAGQLLKVRRNTVDSEKKWPMMVIAVTLALTLLFATSIYYLNWTGFIAGIFAFAPLVLFYIQYRWKTFLAAGIIISLAFFLFLGRFEALFLSVSYLFSSAVMGEMIRQGRPVEQVVLPSIAPPFLSGFGLWFYQAYREQTDPITYFHNLILQSLKGTVDYYEKLGWDKEKIEFLKSAIPDMATVMLSLFPGMYLCSLIFTLFVNFLLVRFILMKFNASSSFQFQALSSWMVSDHVIWGFIAASLFILAPLSILKVVGGNFLILFFLLYFLQGLALMADFFKRKKVPPAWQVFSYIFLLIWPLLGFLVFMAGLSDIWADFRKIRNAPV